MKSAFLVGPRAIEVREVAEPLPSPGGLVLATGACGICGSDLRRWSEGPPPGVDWLVQGHELAGTVVAVAPDAVGYSVGERLAVAPDIHCGACYYCRRGWFNLCTGLKLLGITPGYPGGFAERVSLSAEVLRLGIVHRMPAEASFHEGAMAETLSSVLACQEQCEVSLGEVVVVLGAGPIGCLHAVVARARGARSVVADPNPRRLQGAGRFGPEALLDPGSVDLVQEVRRLTEGRGADVVICANPVAASQAAAVEMVRRAGRVVLFGGLPKKDPITHLNGNLIHYGEVRVLGAFSYHPRFHEEALRMLARKAVRADQFVTRALPLSRVEEAFATASAGEALKVMVEPDGECCSHVCDR
jgi:L-iditol 2-dehydrogenase